MKFLASLTIATVMLSLFICLSGYEPEDSPHTRKPASAVVPDVGM